MIPSGWKDQENSLVSMSESGESKKLGCARLIVGFLTEHAKGLSSFPTLDTERMWRRKAWPPHRSHCDLEVWSGAERAANEPQRKPDLLTLLPFEIETLKRIFTASIQLRVFCMN